MLDRETRPAALAAGSVALLLTVGAAGAMATRSHDACTITTVSVAAAPEIADVVSSAAAAVLESDCVQYVVTEALPSDVAAGEFGSWGGPPDLWVPDSSSWLRRTARAFPRPLVVAPSLASSPVVLVGSGRVSRPSSWLSVWSGGRLTPGDPLRTGAGAAALLALHAERHQTLATEAQIGAAVVPAAQAMTARPAATTALSAAGSAHSEALMVSSEQGYLDFARSHPRATEVVPRTGTLQLDYPLARFTRSDEVSRAATLLSSFLLSPRGSALLEADSLRASGGAPLANGAGLGRMRLLRSPKAALVTRTLQAWELLSAPTRALAVFDVSGSMDLPAGDGNRIQLAVEAAATGVQLFSDSSAVGLWAFSERLGGSTDYRQLVPIRPVGSRVGDVTQRELLRRAAFELTGLTDGGTALYDTTLAAVREVQRHYDPAAVNAVVLLTDGRNDSPGSIGLSELLETLRREHRAEQPVEVIAVAMGPDADVAALRQITQVTGGHTFLARDPSDVRTVYLRSLLTR